jgi:hypothetical protein
MIYSVNVLNPSNDELILELTNPEKSGIQVRHIDGIGPTKSNINIYDVPSIDGGLFNSARTQARQIVLKLGFEWLKLGDHTTPLIEDARHLSYKFFPLKRKIRLEFITDYRTLYIDGYVESNEPDIFSKDETTTVSVMCPDPNFYASDTQYGLINYPNQNKFEFPFSNESLDRNLIEFSTTNGTSGCSIDYEGDNTTGVTLELYFDQDYPAGQNISVSFINNIESTIIDINPSRIIKTTYHDILKGDRLIINGKPGNKGVIYKRRHYEFNTFSAITLRDKWPVLESGENHVVLNAGTASKSIKGRVIYNTLYDGV